MFIKGKHTHTHTYIFLVDFFKNVCTERNSWFHNTTSEDPVGKGEEMLSLCTYVQTHANTLNLRFNVSVQYVWAAAVGSSKEGAGKGSRGIGMPTHGAQSSIYSVWSKEKKGTRIAILCLYCTCQLKLIGNHDRMEVSEHLVLVLSL